MSQNAAMSGNPPQHLDYSLVGEEATEEKED
jgi:hypothetical protein